MAEKKIRAHLAAPCIAFLGQNKKKSRVAQEFLGYPMVILKDSRYSHDIPRTLVPLARLSAMALPSAHPHL